MQQAKQGDFKPFDASVWKIGIVVSEFNKPITDSLLRSALKRAKE
jgi:6,7-dimethyl-8-ribityllumazine synthase